MNVLHLAVLLVTVNYKNKNVQYTYRDILHLSKQFVILYRFYL